ncbi:Mitochondrial pyruvate carrier 2 [Cystobasidiomycetes sp. EMM_F5]
MAAASSKGFQSFMNSPAGPKTIFFWAPLFKWCLVAAGVKDLNRPAENLSIPQNLALTATGLIWVRYSFVITPVNYSLAAVNAFVGATGGYQLFRAVQWQREHPELAKAKDAVAKQVQNTPTPSERIGA